MMMGAPQYTVWGTRADYASGNPIRLMGGTIAECRRECAYRRGLGGWTLTTVREGVRPSESWMNFARQAAQGVPICVGCHRPTNGPSDHATGCPTGQNGSPNYN